MASCKADEARLGLFLRMLVLSAALLLAVSSLFADSTGPKTVTLCFKSYEMDANDGKFIFYLTSSELPASTGDWHPGQVDQGYKIGDMIGTFKLLKFQPMTTKGGDDSFGTDKSILLLESKGKPPVKVVLILGENITATLK